MGGACTWARQNPDGKWVMGGKCTWARQNPDETWVMGGDCTWARQNPDGTWVMGGACTWARQNPGYGIGLGFACTNLGNGAYHFKSVIPEESNDAWLVPEKWSDANYDFTISYSQQKKGYIITEGMFSKGGKIVEFEQDHKPVSGDNLNSSEITGFTILYENTRIRIAVSPTYDDTDVE